MWRSAFGFTVYATAAVSAAVQPDHEPHVDFEQSTELVRTLKATAPSTAALTVTAGGDWHGEAP